MNTKLNTSFKIICSFLIFALVSLSFYNALSLGFSWDEIFHHINGLLRFNYLVSLGKFQEYNYSNNKYYPGLYDTISYFIGNIFEIINNKFYNIYIVEIKHLINLFFSLGSLIGLYLITKIIFNKCISILAVIITFTNPFFFGHTSINPKDIIIFFSIIWFCYFFYKYLFFEKKKFLNLLLMSIFLGFGCGVRISFLAIAFPIVVTGIYILFKKGSQKIFSTSSFFHLIVAVTLVFSLTFITWPHIINEPFSLFIETVKNSINWSAGPKLGLVNGVFYETQFTPTSYFLEMIKFKIPFYFSILFFLSFFLFFFNPIYFYKSIQNFSCKFIIISLIIFFPLLVSILFKVKIYDYLRLFLFIIPFSSILGSLSLYYLINNFSKSFFNKFILCIIFFLFIIFLFRFLILTPYQYTYVNYSNINLKSTINKFEHDYWGTSIKELIFLIKKKHAINEIKNMKFSVCGFSPEVTIFYLKSYFNISKIYRYDEASHVLMTNRASFDIKDKTTCFNQFEGTDVTVVKRDGLTLSVMRSIKK